MDVVYVCRLGNHNEELRYSLRSLANITHDRVFIAGGWPRWVNPRTVTTVPVPRARSKYENTTNNLIAACRAGVSDEFVFMNDDFFVMREMSEIPTLHRGRIGPVAQGHGTYSYAGRMTEMGEWLRANGYTDLCYATHTPIVFHRDTLLDVLAMPAPSEALHVHKRTLYGNVVGIGGTPSHDFKVSADRWSPDWPFLSTNDASFKTRDVGKHIRSRFPDPSLYER